MKFILFICFCLIFFPHLILKGKSEYSTEPDTTFIVTRDLSNRFLHTEPIYNDQNLIAYWPMEEGSGYQCYDWSGNNLNAFMTGHDWNRDASGLTAAFRSSGKRGGCIKLNGKQWLQVQNHELLNEFDEFALLLWIKPDTIKQSGLFHNYDTGGGYKFEMNDMGGLSLGYIDDRHTPAIIHSSATLVNKNIWQEVGIQYNKSEKTLSFIRNGQIIEEHKDFIWPNHPCPADLFIGRSTMPFQCFKGKIDEVTFFSYAVSQEELSQLYISGLPKSFSQTRETIDPDRLVWNFYHGNQPIPHPVNPAAIMNLRFDGHIRSIQGQKATDNTDAEFVPGAFRGALNFQSSTRGLMYRVPEELSQGTLEIWYLGTAKRETPLIMFRGKESNIKVFTGQSCIKLCLQSERHTSDSLTIKNITVPDDALGHIALSWKPYGDSTKFLLYINGIQTASIVSFITHFAEELWIGGSDLQPFSGAVDDVCLSNEYKTWGQICPRGIWETESAALDLMTSFDDMHRGPLFHWTAGTNQEDWCYASKPWDVPQEATCIKQTGKSGFHKLYHPDASGMNASFEASIAVDSIQDGWAGIFVQSPEIGSNSFTGHTLTLNYSTNKIRLASIIAGEIVRKKILQIDFELCIKTIYQLTLSSVDGILRGFIDNRNIISMFDETNMDSGFAGLITMDVCAYFDDVHFSALTPPVDRSRKIEVRLIKDDRLSISRITVSAFRWKKRYGSLLWLRDYKIPEPPGNIFGPDKNTVRPNPSYDWRSEDAANSALVTVNQHVYYFMRGNPDVDGIHGNAHIGVLHCTKNEFDGIHFKDLTGSQGKDGKIMLLKGHRDTNKGGCNDDPPRDKRFQLNDEGCVYMNGKILLVCREFRNSNPRSVKFRRLVLGIFDVYKSEWIKEEPFLMDWSRMDPDSCYGTFHGINATPEITLLRDPATDRFIVLLFHHRFKRTREINLKISEKRYNMVSGFFLKNRSLEKHPEYPAKPAVHKDDNDNLYGERVMFDNGIWYMNVNGHSVRLVRDWPDRFELFTALEPYQGPWIESHDNLNRIRPYFERGNEIDPDNGAIWQGEMFKYRNHYYMYYENFHAIEDVNEPYQYYNHPETGSRVGYAVGN